MSEFKKWDKVVVDVADPYGVGEIGMVVAGPDEDNIYDVRLARGPLHRAASYEMEHSDGSKVLIGCARCGEMLGVDQARAELASTAQNPDFDPPPDNMTAVVCAEPCATEMLASGQWEIA